MRGGFRDARVLVAGVEDARPRRWPRCRRCSSPSGSGSQSLGSRWPRPSQPPQHRPIPPTLTGFCVVDPGLAVDRVHGDAPNTPWSPDPPQSSPGSPHHGHSKCCPVTWGPRGRPARAFVARGPASPPLAGKLAACRPVRAGTIAGWRYRCSPRSPAGCRVSSTSPYRRGTYWIAGYTVIRWIAG